MWEDPIVAEVDRTRELLAANFNFDVEAIFADIRKRQTALGERLIPQRKQTEPKAGKESTDSVNSDDFRKMIEERRQEKPVPWDVASEH
jgi:hypothetical protein